MRSIFTPLTWLLIAYVALLAVRGKVWNGEGIDECYYFAQVASPVFDGDLNFENDFLQSRNSYDMRLALANRIYRDGKTDLPFPCGMAVISAPAILAVKFVHGRRESDDRYAYSYRAAFTLTTWMAVLLGLIACQRIASRFTNEACAALLAGALFLGTNLCYYTWVAPAMSHGASFGIAALFLLSVFRYRESPCGTRAAIAGALAGLAFLVRWQDAILFIAFFATWFWGPRRRRDLVVAGVFAFLVAMPQFIVWKKIYGSALAIPQGGEFFVAQWWRPFAVLFSPLNGWIASHPILALFVAAFVVLRRDRLIAVCFAIVIIEIIVNSLAGDWWAGGSFGNRRFISVYPLLIPAAAVAASRATGVGKSFAAVFTAGCIAVNVLLVSRFTYEAPHPIFWGRFFSRLPDYVQFLT
ncbi:MAG: hypothetical protein ABI579_03910, partial [Candidatus Sumerlaeota bacterium]